ncbi:restriction endonuclease subunit S [Geobacillus genomosp. 3]|uniref:restriction endonuclease subunit S n=1 Tax=Geobacillus genomosp. 3 TaxID=1921421 RepID=UPI001F19F28B|nr:restriction endonuclease subunit S [Geobacillus genomosp. 3]
MSRTKLANEFPKDWEIRKLYEIGSTYSGLTNKNKEDFENGNSKFITYKNIYNNTFIDINELESVRINPGEKQNEVKYGDVFFTGSSETPDEVGISSVLLEDIKNVYLNSFCFGFRFNDINLTIPEFYGYYFRGPIFRREVYPLAQGSTRFNLSKSELIKLKIPIPPVPEQRKIAAILSSVDEAIEKTETIIEQTEKVKKGLMQQLLTKGIGHTKFKKTEIGEIPEEWDIKRLEELSDRIFVGIATSTTEHYCETGIPIIRNQNIKENFLDSNDMMFITEHFDMENRNKKLKPGDILTVRTGYPGTSCVVPDSFEGAQTFTTLVTRPKHSIIDAEFLCRYINSHIGKKYVLGGQVGGAQKNLNVSVMAKLPVPVPPMNEQKKIRDILISFENKILCEKHQLETLENLKKSLMQSLLTGKVRVKVDEDEVMSS